MALFGRKVKAAAPSPEPEASPATAPGPRPSGVRSVEEHRAQVLSKVEPLPWFGMGLMDAWGLTLCEDVASDADLPGLDRADADGYAVRAADLAGAGRREPAVLEVVGDEAMHDAEGLGRGMAAVVSAGAPLPAGADAVVPIHLTDGGRDRVAVREPVPTGAHLSRRGSELSEGDPVLPRGSRLDARSIALLAGAGIDKVLVRPRPRVVVVATGAGVVEPGRPLELPGQVHDASSHLVAAEARAAGCQVWRVQVPSNDAAAVREAIADQLIRADLVVVTGGNSPDARDALEQAMDGIGEGGFVDVAAEPCSRQGFALVGDDRVPTLVLPGDAVAVHAGFHAFARPLLRRLVGVEPVPEAVRCVAGHAIPSTKGRMQLALGLVRDEQGRRTVELVGAPGSRRLTDLAASNALVLLPEGRGAVRSGDRVDVWMLDRG